MWMTPLAGAFRVVLRVVVLAVHRVQYRIFAVALARHDGRAVFGELVSIRRRQERRGVAEHRFAIVARGVSPSLQKRSCECECASNENRQAGRVT